MRSQKEGLTYTEPTFVRNSNSPVRIFSRIAGMTVTTGEGELGLSGERVNPGGDDNYTDYCEGEPYMFWPPTVRSGRLQLRPLPSAGVTQLHRYYGPLRHPTRPGLSLASCQLIPTAITAGASRVASGLQCVHAIAISPAGSMELVRSSISIACGLPCVTVRSAPAIFFFGVCPAFTHVMACTLAESPSDPHTESPDSFVASAAASIAGWSEPVPGRELHPLKPSAFSRRTFTPTIPGSVRMSQMPSKING